MCLIVTIAETLQVGDKVYPVATLRKNRGQVFKFFCDDKTLKCTPLDVSLSAHAEAVTSAHDKYVWEYVETCSFETQPCEPQHAPSVLLRRCPPGTVMTNR